jgi:hypothetical protein
VLTQRCCDAASQVGIEGWEGLGSLYSPAAIDLWDQLHAQGFTNVAPIGGSDDHRGGVNETINSPVGNPTTLVLAANLSHSAIIEGVQLGRTVVKMYGPNDPMVVFQCNSSVAGLVDVGSACPGAVSLVATVSTPPTMGTVLTVLRNNAVMFEVTVPPDTPSFPWSENVTPPVGTAPDRWRAELRDAGSYLPRTLTNHVFVTA